MNNQPLVSVIIPLYNNEKYICAALDSVFAQDHLNMEVIVVNDGSTDKSLMELEPYLDRIMLIDQVNGGASSARNTGILASAGKYVAFLDADDLWLPGKITAQVEFLESNGDFGLVCVNLCRSGDKEKVLINQSGWIMDSLLNSCELWTSAVMVKRSVIDSVGVFDETLMVGEDYDLWLRIASRIKCHIIDEIYAVYRINETSLTFKFIKKNHRLDVFLKLKNNPYKYQSDVYTIDQKRVSKKLSTIASDYAYSCRQHSEFFHGFKSALYGIWSNMYNISAYKEFCYNLCGRKVS